MLRLLGLVVFLLGCLIGLPAGIMPLVGEPVAGVIFGVPALVLMAIGFRWHRAAGRHTRERIVSPDQLPTKAQLDYAADLGLQISP